MSDDEGCVAALVALAIATALMLPFALLNGWVLSILWRWFALPLFPALPHLGVLPAAGLALTAKFMTHEFVDTDTDRGVFGGLAVACINGLLYPAAVLLLGWLLLWAR